MRSIYYYQRVINAHGLLVVTNFRKENGEITQRASEIREEHIWAIPCQWTTNIDSHFIHLEHFLAAARFRKIKGLDNDQVNEISAGYIQSICI